MVSWLICAHLRCEYGTCEPIPASREGHGSGSLLLHISKGGERAASQAGCEFSFRLTH